MIFGNSPQGMLKLGHCFIGAVSENNILTLDDTSENISDKINFEQPSYESYCNFREAQLEEMLDVYRHISERLKIFTILPPSMTCQEISDKFETTVYMARRAKQMRETGGVLASSISKAGHKLSNDSQKSTFFYEKNSRRSKGQNNNKK
ncbi:hypothetical protein ABEB36_004772 [Hypothenemus hampei]|uniref:Uncharacterized protein n=1 Tax=Hypothenemus hampei TaxID=57062 RepID=A0ABD1EVW1_HYPHA